MKTLWNLKLSLKKWIEILEKFLNFNQENMSIQSIILEEKQECFKEPKKDGMDLILCILGS
jgi:hypothetical protein